MHHSSLLTVRSSLVACLFVPSSIRHHAPAIGALRQVQPSATPMSLAREDAHPESLQASWPWLKALLRCIACLPVQSLADCAAPRCPPHFHRGQARTPNDRRVDTYITHWSSRDRHSTYFSPQPHSGESEPQYLLLPDPTRRPCCCTLSSLPWPPPALLWPKGSPSTRPLRASLLCVPSLSVLWTLDADY